MAYILCHLPPGLYLASNSYMHNDQHCSCWVSLGTPGPCQGGQMANWSQVHYSNELQMPQKGEICSCMYQLNETIPAISVQIHTSSHFNAHHKSHIQRSKYLNIFLFSARVSIPQMLDNRRMAGCGSSDEDPYRFKKLC